MRAEAGTGSPSICQGDTAQITEWGFKSVADETESVTSMFHGVGTGSLGHCLPEDQALQGSQLPLAFQDVPTREKQDGVSYGRVSAS